MIIPKQYLFLFILFYFCSTVAQIVFEDERKGFLKKIEGRKLEGYVKYEFYGDTRQVFGFRSNQFLLFPLGPDFDKKGRDINDRGQLMQNAIETRFRYTMSREKTDTWDLNAVVEADFFGLSTPFSDHGGVFRFRHAYLELISEHAKILCGHTWHPITILDCYPDTISFNGGAPYESATRNVTVIGTLMRDSAQLIVGAISQLNFTSDGPKGFTNEYARNGIMPDLHIQLKKVGKGYVLGAGYDIKRIAPRIVTNEDFVTHESLLSHSIFAYCSYIHDHFVFATKYSYCENGTDYGNLGGYGVHSIDPITDKRTYANIGVSNFWFDITARASDRVIPGIFFGYTFNHGSQDTILPDLITDQGVVIEKRAYGFDNSIGQSFRIQPRVRVKSGPVVFGVEVEWSAALFGDRNQFAQVPSGQWKLNTRILGALFYLF